MPTVVGCVSKLATMPLIDTGSAATLNDISIWPIAMMIIGSQESRASFCSSGLAAAFDMRRFLATDRGVAIEMQSVFNSNQSEPLAPPVDEV